MTFLREQVVGLGVRIEDGVRVVGWRTEGGKLVAAKTPSDDLAADAFVLGAGVWSADLARGLGLSLPMLAGKGLSLTLRRPARLPQTPSILTEARVAVTPMGEDLRFGGTMELGTRDLAPSPARVRGIVKSAARYFPELGAEAFQDVRPWCGLRPCSPDGLPYIGRFERHPNLIAATGHAMMGVSLGPITGQLVAEMLSGETPSIPPGLLRPDRYS
jgi:D-amino-acid dehydrogenase